MEIADLAVARAADARIARIVVEVGKLTAVLPDALAFAWDAVRAESATLVDCRLELVEIAGRGRCRVCGEAIVLTAAFGRCGCGSTDLEIVAGEELRIRELEVS
jgi:hydrogenase nickel incorporation protein HypA/HybF